MAFLIIFLITLGSATAAAQDRAEAAAPDRTEADGQDSADAATQDHVHEEPALQAGWTWIIDANVFAGYNYQRRRYTDFTAWESQNWGMLAGRRPLGPGQLSVHGMVSLEPFTIRNLGSPQVFQTGETYENFPLVDYQHPHDLVMQLGATYRREHRRAAYWFGADVVGSPSLGPVPFMHRDSARDNPQAPLAHHYLDSTHITPGVLRGGVGVGAFTLEGSVFRGQSPDEDRLDIDEPRLNSWATRICWRRGPWQAQISGGRLRQPESFVPGDATRLTASVGFDGDVGTRPLNATIAWGQNRELHGIFDSVLAEWRWGMRTNDTVYGRGELMEKEIVGLGHIHDAFAHPIQISKVAALTLGYVRDLAMSSWGRFGVGGDFTAYRTSADLFDPYGYPRSFHLFFRWRPVPPAAGAHIH
jgi:hypothetical protein